MRKKQQLTITLPPEILEKVDAVIDYSDISNRSQAIEFLITQGFEQKVETAVILAGGKKVLTRNIALKKIHGQSLLNIMINQLKLYGFKKIILCVEASSRQIENIFSNGSDRGVNIEYVYETKPMGSAGALLAAKKLIQESTFLLMYGDILTDMNFKNFIDFHFIESNTATIGVKPRMGENKYGQVMIQGNTAVNYSTKESNDALGLVNTGLYIFSKVVFDYITANAPMDIDHDLIPKLIDQKQLSAFVFQGIWHDISAQSDFEEAVAKWK
ncbi:MAG: hypothetical protein GW946_01635 [Candidatus Pacebacteria bacterium]|nr:hypothetical protein [Candidatus Paceibacterota bacterium]PIR60587.1 MAG: hypothetical protein COU67_01375 [Candidatus Pacebacteria bacterium CG10_big_fil_rev_8_21_14_0_10_44_54]